MHSHTSFRVLPNPPWYMYVRTITCGIRQQPSSSTFSPFKWKFNREMGNCKEINLKAYRTEKSNIKTLNCHLFIILCTRMSFGWLLATAERGTPFSILSDISMQTVSGCRSRCKLLIRLGNHQNQNLMSSVLSKVLRSFSIYFHHFLLAKIKRRNSVERVLSQIRTYIVI